MQWRVLGVTDLVMSPSSHPRFSEFSGISPQTYSMISDGHKVHQRDMTPDIGMRSKEREELDDRFEKSWRLTLSLAFRSGP